VATVPRRAALAIAAAAVAAALHLAAAPAHLPAAPPPLALAHPRHPTAPPSTAPADQHADHRQVAPLRGGSGRPEPPLVATSGTAPAAPPMLGLAFLAAGVYGLAIAAWLLARPSSTPAWAAAAGGHLAMVAAGLASRTVGLLGHTDPWWEPAFVAAVIAELAVVGAAVPELRPRPGRRQAPVPAQ
jgi:hypothetical protein